MAAWASAVGRVVARGRLVEFPEVRGDARRPRPPTCNIPHIHTWLVKLVVKLEMNLSMDVSNLKTRVGNRGFIKTLRVFPEICVLCL